MAKDGGVFSFGDAAFHGSTGNLRLNAPVVGMAATRDGTGYWLVGADGGVFSFSAPFLGSMGASHLNRPVEGITADPGGRGYRMVAADGGIFSFGAPFYGSLGGTPISAPIQTMAPSLDGNGYYLMGSDGAFYAFGDAPIWVGCSRKLGDPTGPSPRAHDRGRARPRATPEMRAVARVTRPTVR